MQYSHSSDKALKFAESAFKRMSAEVLAPTPENYELWYVYFSKENPEVSHAIDVLVESNVKITNEHCAEIYQRLLSDSSENERVRQAGDKINDTIKDVTSVVTNVKNTTVDYNTKINSASGRLSSDLSQEEMVQIVGTIQNDTRGVLVQNQALETQLTKATSIMRELQEDLEQVRKEALTDGLTLISNRKAFDNEIRDMIDHCTASGETFSLILMDIDHFKKFNDDFGHQVGDQVLKLVARTLLDNVKGRDMAARYGGEEFAILLPTTNLDAAALVADKLRKEVEAKEVINRNTGKKMGRITMSGGVGQFVLNENVEDFIDRVDASLYQSKNKGRNCISKSRLS